MSLRGPILLVEDDKNDAEVIAAAIRELDFRNEIKHFAEAKDALAYLMTTEDKPLIILCDIRMPGMDGLALLKKIAETEFLRLKAIPFVLLTGVVTPEIVNEAYRFGVQGFYRKPASYDALKEQLYFILHYWSRSIHPQAQFGG